MTGNEDPLNCGIPPQSFVFVVDLTHIGLSYCYRQSILVCLIIHLREFQRTLDRHLSLCPEHRQVVMA